MATLVGWGGTAGAVGVVLILQLTARFVYHDGIGDSAADAYAVLFVIAGMAYLLAMLAVRVVASKMRTVEATALAEHPMR